MIWFLCTMWALTPGSLNNIDFASAPLLLDDFDPGSVSHLCLVLIGTRSSLVFMPSSVTVCASFDAQWETAGSGTSLDCNLFSKTDCSSSHLSTELSRVRVSCPSVVTNHTTHCLSKLLSKTSSPPLGIQCLWAL